MTIDASVLSLGLTVLLIGVVFDCNRRIRELQRTSDLHTRWMDHLIRESTGRRHRDDDDPESLPRRRR